VAAFVSKTIRARSVGGFYVIVQGEMAPTDEDWDRMLTHSVNGGKMPPTLVYTYGGAPNVGQRARLQHAFGDHKPKMAVVTPSAAARMIATAVAWFNPAVKLFGPGEVEPALDHLGVTAVERSKLRTELDEMRAAMAPKG
jgi:hypothetical protein